MTAAFASELGLHVFREGRPARYLGSTLDLDDAGRPKAVAVPASGWFVRPVDPKIADEHLAPIIDEVVRCSIPGLSLAGCRRLGDAAMAGLARLAHLEFLELFNTTMTDEGGAWLGRLPGLQRVSVAGTQLGDAGLAAIAKHPTLRALDLGWTQVTDQGLQHLRGHPGLVSLSLRATQVSNAGLAAVAEIPGLRHLDLQETAVGDAGVAALRPLAATLEHLLVGYTAVTNRCIDDLAALRSLRTLMLRVTQIERERDGALAARLQALGSGDDGRGLVR